MASIYDLPEDLDLAEAYKYAQLDPFERSAMEGRLFQKRQERNIETALGVTPSPARNREMAGRELHALSKTVRPGTPEFYEQAIPILQKYGIVAEAQEMEKQRLALETGKAELDPLMKMKRTRDLLSKSPDAATPAGQAAIAAIDRKIAAYGTLPEKAAADPEFIKLLNAYEAARDAGQGDRAETIKKMMDAMLKAKEQSGQDVQWARLALAQAVEARHVGKETRKVEEAEAQAGSALQGSIRALDEEISAATRLLAHPGMNKIIGPRMGALPETAVAAIGTDHAGAIALYLTLQGQTFIRALQDLKATSKTGASGLGQLTEIEGNKIQQAKAAISRQQSPDQFRRTINAYLTALQSGRDTAAKILADKGGDVPAAPPIPSDRPAVSDVAPSAGGMRAKAATPAPAAPATPRRFRTVP